MLYCVKVDKVIAQGAEHDLHGQHRVSGAAGGNAGAGRKERRAQSRGAGFSQLGSAGKNGIPRFKVCFSAGVQAGAALKLLYGSGGFGAKDTVRDQGIQRAVRSGNFP